MENNQTVIEPAPIKPRFQIGNLVMSYTQGPLVSGYAIDGGTVHAKEDALGPTRWHGSKIPVGMFHQLVSFFTWVNTTYKTEATARLYYNICTQEWVCEVLNQKICGGLAAKELDNSPENAALQNTLYAKGFSGNGSMHSHCTASAFQSGVDERDERQDAGFHITVGHLGQPVVDMHCRYTAYGLVYKVVNEDWFLGDIKKDYLTVSDGFPFPEEWKSRMKFVVDPVIQRSSLGARGRYSYMCNDDDDLSCYGGWVEGDRIARIYQNSANNRKKFSGKFRQTSISDKKCEHKYIEGSFLPEDLIRNVYDSVIDASLSCDDSDSSLMSRYLIQFLVAASVAARAQSYVEEGDDANRMRWRKEINRLLTIIDRELDKFNPVYELLSGFGVFTKLPSTIPLSTILDSVSWDIDLRTLIGAGAITKESLNTMVDCDAEAIKLPDELEWSSEGVLKLKDPQCPQLT